MFVDKCDLGKREVSFQQCEFNLPFDLTFVMLAALEDACWAAAAMEVGGMVGGRYPDAAAAEE